MAKPSKKKAASTQKSKAKRNAPGKTSIAKASNARASNARASKLPFKLKKGTAKPVVKPAAKPSSRPKLAAKAAVSSPKTKASPVKKSPKPAAVKVLATRPVAAKPVAARPVKPSAPPVKPAPVVIASKPLAKPFRPIATPMPPKSEPFQMQPAVATNLKPRKSQIGLGVRELEHFADMLLAKRRELVGDMSSMEREALRTGSGSNLSTLPVHMADMGTDNYEQEFTLTLVEKDRTLLREINHALAKIQNGTYGICEGTGKAIGKPRLEVQPWARFSIEYARQREKNGMGVRTMG